MHAPASIRVLARIVGVALLLAAVVATTGCTQGLPTETPGITGTATSVTPGQGGLVMLVEGGEQPAGAVSDRAQVTVPESAPVFDASGAEADASAIKLGAQVKVWFDGAVAESYPVQGTAKVVQVVAPAP